MLCWQMLFRSRAPPHRDSQLRGDVAEIFERPAFLRTARKGMDHREVPGGPNWNRDARNAFDHGRKRREECERQMPDGIAEFLTVRTVPGVNGIELL